MEKNSENGELKENGVSKSTLVICRSSAGVELRGTLTRLTRFNVVFELYTPAAVLRVTEVLADFRIIFYGQAIYSGRGVVRGLMNIGDAVLCDATLNEASWADVRFDPTKTASAYLQERFGEFLQDWQKSYKITPAYKSTVADIHTFLTDLRLWVEQVELSVRSNPKADDPAAEREVAETICQSAFPVLDNLFEKYEGITVDIEKDLEPVHQVYVRRQLHPLLLSSPFAFRSVAKPLGYAGDYEIIGMILRDPHEGGSLFAKVLNRWFIKQPPAAAHRNRINYLTEHLIFESAAAARANRPLRVLSVGCGPAQEVQRFLKESTLADRAEITLMDFNAETLAYTEGVMRKIKQDCHLTTSLKFVKKSVHHILKESARNRERSPDECYDFIYCAGLFDYVTDSVCRKLTGVFFEWLAPGGLGIVTNVDVCNPIRHWLSYVLEWDLIYRDGAQLLALRPDRCSADESRLVSDATGVNIFLEFHKPPKA